MNPLLDQLSHSHMDLSWQKNSKQKAMTKQQRTDWLEVSSGNWEEAGILFKSITYDLEKKPNITLN